MKATAFLETEFDKFVVNCGDIYDIFLGFLVRIVSYSKLTVNWIYFLSAPIFVLALKVSVGRILFPYDLKYMMIHNTTQNTCFEYIYIMSKTK